MDLSFAFNFIDMVLIFAAGFTAAFMDATVGGGGLITLPMFMGMGWPVAYAMGTNKVAAVISLGTSAYTYYKAGKLDHHILKLLPLAFAAGISGGLLIMVLPADFLRYVVVGLLTLVGIYTFFHKNLGQKNSKPLNPFYKKWCMLIAIVLGFYDGFFGPGSGTFYIFSFLWVGYDYVTASANGKMLTTAAVFGAFLIFLYNGTVVWIYALAMAFGLIPGAIVGSRFVMTHDLRFIRPMYLAMVTILIGKQIYLLLK